ncbi:set5, partial [Symbiodinium necroappetens]
AYQNFPCTPVHNEQRRGAFCLYKGSALGVVASTMMARRCRTLRAPVQTDCRATTAPV